VPSSGSMAMSTLWRRAVADDLAVGQLPEALSRNVGPRVAASAENDERPAERGFRACAEEDSNLHPVIPDQALNLVRACTMRAVSFYAVDFVHAGEHIGRSGRSGCCHACCRDKRPGGVDRQTSAMPGEANRLGSGLRSVPYRHAGAGDDNICAVHNLSQLSRALRATRDANRVRASCS
jgi:hypothetical protein